MSAFRAQELSGFTVAWFGNRSAFGWARRTRFTRAVGRDNCVRFEGLALQLPADRHRAHCIKARVKVRRHADGTLSVWHGPRRLAKCASTGEPLADGELAAAA